MIGFLQNIEELTLQNDFFRQVLYTGQHTQLVLMSLKPNEEIGMEVHEIVDQFLRVEAGEGKLIMNAKQKLGLWKTPADVIVLGDKIRFDTY